MVRLNGLARTLHDAYHNLLDFSTRARAPTGSPAQPKSASATPDCGHSCTTHSEVVRYVPQDVSSSGLISALLYNAVALRFSPVVHACRSLFGDRHSPLPVIASARPLCHHCVTWKLPEELDKCTIDPGGQSPERHPPHPPSRDLTPLSRERNACVVRRVAISVRRIPFETTRSLRAQCHAPA